MRRGREEGSWERRIADREKVWDEERKTRREEWDRGMAAKEKEWKEERERRREEWERGRADREKQWEEERERRERESAGRGRTNIHYYRMHVQHVHSPTVYYYHH